MAGRGWQRTFSVWGRCDTRSPEGRLPLVHVGGRAAVQLSVRPHPGTALLRTVPLLLAPSISPVHI